jgi:hypothetical protein
MSLNIAKWVIIGFSIFLVLDGFLAIIPGEQYMLWGLEYAPAWYSSMVKNLIEWPPLSRLGLKLAEIAVVSKCLVNHHIICNKY